MTITIKEVYEQCLANGWLGKEEARIAIGNDKNGILIGKVDSAWVHSDINEDCFYTLDSSKVDGWQGCTEVEWIGNQPKKKMLYACLVKWAIQNENSFQLMYLTKDNDEYKKFIWLPEEQYPPIEIDDSEEG